MFLDLFLMAVSRQLLALFLASCPQFLGWVPLDSALALRAEHLLSILCPHTVSIFKKTEPEFVNF